MFESLEGHCKVAEAWTDSYVILSQYKANTFGFIFSVVVDIFHKNSSNIKNNTKTNKKGLSAFPAFFCDLFITSETDMWNRPISMLSPFCECLIVLQKPLCSQFYFWQPRNQFKYTLDKSVAINLNWTCSSFFYQASVSNKPGRRK